jgi:hypothetical protein
MSKEYFEKKALSASLLKALATSPRNARAIIENENTESTAFTMGSLVDCLLTTPERFEEDYVIFTGISPTDKMLDFANEYIRLYKLLSEDNTHTSEELILLARTYVDYDKRLKDDTVIKKFEEACNDYIQCVLYNPDKIVIDTETYNTALELVRVTKESPHLQFIFNPKEGDIVLFQVPIYIESNKFVGKALLDCIVIDTINKTITPIDFKTYEDSFEGNYWKYKYYYQEAWYSFLLNMLTDGESFITKLDTVEKLLNVAGYTVTDFKFVAIDKSFQRNPIIFQSYKAISDDVFFGGFINKGITNLVKVKSIQDLIKEYNWRVEKDDWVNDYDMETQGFKKLWL